MCASRTPEPKPIPQRGIIHPTRGSSATMENALKNMQHIEYIIFKTVGGPGYAQKLCNLKHTKGVLKEGPNTKTQTNQWDWWPKP